jgi:chromosomal replication initiation ATPase DnaA|tara:strand:+ start:8625 stop:9155 length:531 start_codon:yes stop_codon:yes gene_type:complete
MTDNQKIEQKIKQITQIKKFKLEFYKEHDIKLFILSPKTDNQHACTLETYKALTMLSIVEDHPKFKDYNFDTRSRERDFIMYIQVMSFLANNDGYSKTAIGEAINRNHATVINSCKIVSNAVYTKDENFTRILKKLQNKIDNYVGLITEDIERENDTKSVPDPIWNEARHFLASNQ